MTQSVLYTGIDPARFITSKRLVHFPLIEVKIHDLSSHQMKTIWDDFHEYTHILFTSKSTVSFFLQAMEYFNLPFSFLGNKKIFSIGKVTASFLEKAGFKVDKIAEVETQEGIIPLLMGIENGYLFYPRSSQARSIIENFLIEKEIRHQICNLYSPEESKKEISFNLDEFDEIVFTSPSTVRAFIKLFTTIPRDKKITCIGPVTEEAYRLSNNQ